MTKERIAGVFYVGSLSGHGALLNGATEHGV